MEDAQNLFKMSLEEVDRMLSTKHVVGEPMVIEGNTLIPLISIGFGFGAGGGSGSGARGGGSGSGAGTGAGGGVKPVGVIIVDKDGVKIETLHGAAASVAEKVADMVARFMEARAAKKKEE